MFGIRAQPEDTLIPGDSDVSVLKLDDDRGRRVIAGMSINVRGRGRVLRDARLGITAGLRVVALGSEGALLGVVGDGSRACRWDCDRGKNEGTCRYQRQCRDFSSGHLWLTWSTKGVEVRVASLLPSPVNHKPIELSR